MYHFDMKPTPQIRSLAHKVALAHAGLTALCDHHNDGINLPGAETTLERVLCEVEEAAKQVEEMSITIYLN